MFLEISQKFTRFTTLLKRRLWHRCFPVNFAKILRTPFLQNTTGQLLLSLVNISLLQQNFFWNNSKNECYSQSWSRINFIFVDIFSVFISCSLKASISLSLQSLLKMKKCAFIKNLCVRNLKLVLKTIVLVTALMSSKRCCINYFWQTKNISQIKLL